MGILEHVDYQRPRTNRIKYIGSVDHSIHTRMVQFYKKILQHVAEYCEQAAIHGPQHIVSERLTRYERLVINSNEKCLLFLYEYSSDFKSGSDMLLS